ncbi:hypothetical protein [Rufibacter sp. LB8]|uniref:hypothetical protein n=1 Tax=Rufibacter sp. LB8 TaxID=2777781 RepID=UPI00178C3870|nr:hypothetical protein [Rufibacter sp. LB8]
MKKSHIYWGTGLLLGLLMVVLAFPAEAQCAMCRASVESSNGESPDNITNGLNKGILYLMAVPYILAAGVGFFWYKYSKKR